MQTGSGKTFTITGGAERYADRGIIPRALSYIFNKVCILALITYSSEYSFFRVPIQLFNFCHKLAVAEFICIHFIWNFKFRILGNRFSYILLSRSLPTLEDYSRSIILIGCGTNRPVGEWAKALLSAPEVMRLITERIFRNGCIGILAI